MIPALQAAAERTGVDFSFLFQTARLESSFRPDAKAKTSSATGLFQFIDSTWLATLRKHGATHGIQPNSRAEALELRKDPAVASLMAAEHAADNAATLEKGLGRKAEPADLYLAHFLGSGGAVRFLKGLSANPAMAAAEMLPAAAQANKAIFFREGMPRSLQGVHDLLARRFNGEAAASGAAPVEPAALVSRPRTAPAHPHLERSTMEQLAHGATIAHGNPAASQVAADPRRVAQAAYLLLAEIGV